MSLANEKTFERYLEPVRQCEWAGYAKRPFSGPEAVLSYLARYTHRVAIANSRLIKADKQSVTFKWKDYRIKGEKRHGTMTLSVDEFIRRFLIHILPDQFHRIRHYGFLSNAVRTEELANVRRALQIPSLEKEPTEEIEHTFVCRVCDTPMKIVAITKGFHYPARAPPQLTAVSV